MPLKVAQPLNIIIATIKSIMPTINLRDFNILFSPYAKQEFD
jgi:hypothetical protein